MEMDHQSDHQKQHEHHHRYYYYYKFLRGGGGTNNTMQFVMISSSLCAFCLLFVWFSFCCTGFFLLPHDSSSFINVYFFTVISRTLQRKYMFLICNAILAFLAKFSSFSYSNSPSSSSPSFNNLDLHPSDLPHTKPLPSENASLMLQQVLQPQQQHVEEEEEKPDLEQEDHELVLPDAEEAKINDASVARHYQQEQQEEEEEDDDEDEDEENDKTLVMATNEELVNTEELNRKFEEFIRRMKEEIRIEAQTQLIAV